LRQKTERTKQLSHKATICFLTFLALVLGSYLITGLGIYGRWLSPWAWILGAALTAILLESSYSEISRKWFKRLGIYLLICFLAVMPIFSISQMIEYQSLAQNLTSQKQVAYFRNLLGRSYNYTELVQWMESNMSWDKSGFSQITDPIGIYQGQKARCGGYAVLYAELCISQGYQARIVINLFGDHAWDEVKLGDNWIRVDASPTGQTLSGNFSYHVGYPFFYEEIWHTPPILALAFENSSIADVTTNYRSDQWSLLSGTTVFFVLVGMWFGSCIFIIQKKLGLKALVRRSSRC